MRQETNLMNPRTATGKPLYTSDNHPMKVDYVPDEELFMSEMGTNSVYKRYSPPLTLSQGD